MVSLHPNKVSSEPLSGTQAAAWKAAGLGLGSVSVQVRPISRVGMGASDRLPGQPLRSWEKGQEGQGQALTSFWPLWAVHLVP